MYERAYFLPINTESAKSSRVRTREVDACAERVVMTQPRSDRYPSIPQKRRNPFTVLYTFIQKLTPPLSPLEIYRQCQ